jgi:molybdopterin-guanine dinucleotide biosynthesis protein
MIRRSDSYFTDDKKTSGTINKSSGVQCRILMLDRANIQLEINVSKMMMDIDIIIISGYKLNANFMHFNVLITIKLDAI